jgi:hypothetical protein
MEEGGVEVPLAGFYGLTVLQHSTLHDFADRRFSSTLYMVDPYSIFLIQRREVLRVVIIINMHIFSSTPIAASVPKPPILPTPPRLALRDTICH